MPQISYIARAFVQERLLDAETGFNYWFPFVAPDYQDVAAFQLVQGTNLFIGALTAPLIDQSGNATYPMCILSSAKGSNNNIVTPNEFAGPLITNVDWWIGFYDSAPPADTESLGDAIEDAMYETFNNAEYYGLETGTGLTYNGEMDFTRGPVQQGGPNWIQLIRFTMLHRFVSAGR